MYEGIEITSQDSYIFDTLPYNPEINMDEIRLVESKLRDYTNGYTQEGITYDEAFKFLDWITYNARSFATSNIPESAMSAPLTGECAPTQRVNTIILQKMGLDVRPFNMGECVGTTPMTQEDVTKMENGWSSTNVRHSVALVRIPIEEQGTTILHTYLLDPTFRQFCLKENCNESIYYDKEKNNKGYVAPHPAYFLTEEYLRSKGESIDKIQNSKYVAEVLISRGYMELTEETAKIYGDAFAKAGIREQFKDTKLNMTGRDYIKEFANNRMELLPNSERYNNFTNTPLEIEDKKTILDKIKDFFKRIKERKNQKYLPEPKSYDNNRKNFLENIKYNNYQYPDLNNFEHQDTKNKENER